MAIAYCILLAFIFAGLRMTKSSDGDSFLDSAHCLPIKGVCISLVFLSHVSGYLYSSQLGALHGLERVILFFNDNFGQLMVVPFLFFSGYGVARCLETKGDAYLRAMPRRRIFRTLVRFDIAVLCFALLNLLLGVPMSIRQVCLSFVCWDSVGNSNWYIFIILICYLSTWISCKLGQTYSLTLRSKNCLLLLILLAVMVLLTFYRDGYWYNTILAYPAGAFYAVHRDYINMIFRNHFGLSAAFLASLTAGIHIVAHYLCLPSEELLYNLKGVSFAFLIVCLMTRVELRSIPLSWMGENLFEIYIYQRLPMIVMITLMPSTVMTYHGAFVIVSALATVAIVFLIRTVKGMWSHKI